MIQIKRVFGRGSETKPVNIKIVIRGVNEKEDALIKKAMQKALRKLKRQGVDAGFEIVSHVYSETMVPDLKFVQRVPRCKK